MAVEEFDELSGFGDDDRPSVRRQAGPTSTKARTRRSPNPRRIKIAVFAIAIVGTIAAAGYFMRRFLLENERFRVASVEVKGVTFFAPEDIEAIFLPDMKKSVINVPLEQRIAEIQELPWVLSVSVRRILPNQIRVTVNERIPVAFVSKEDGLGLIDSAGVILELPDGASFQFPVVRGIEESDTAAERKQKMEVYAALMKDLDRGGLPRESISEVSLEDPEDARLVLSDAVGSTLLHLGNDNYFARYQTYLTNVNDWRGKFPHLHSVDLRYKGQVVVNADPSPAAQIKAKITQASEKQIEPSAPKQIASNAHNAANNHKKVIASTGPVSPKSSKKLQRR